MMAFFSGVIFASTFEVVFSYNHADVWILGSMYVILASATIAGGRIMAKGKTEMPHLMRIFTGETDDEHALARTDCRSRMHA